MHLFHFLFIEEVDTILYIPWTSTVGLMFIAIVGASYGGESILNINKLIFHLCYFIYKTQFVL